MSTATIQKSPKTQQRRTVGQKAQETLSGHQKSPVAASLTEKLQAKLANPANSPEFDLHAATSDVLKDVGLTTADAGGKISFQGADPILPSTIRFGTMAAI